MTYLPSSVAVWFGAFGGGFAWLGQFVTNLFIVYFSCSLHGRWNMPLHGLQIGIGALGIAVAVASSAIALRLYVQTRQDQALSLRVIRGFGGEPPAARLHILAIVGLTVNLMALAIMLLTTIGAPVLLECRQS